MDQGKKTSFCLFVLIALFFTPAVYGQDTSSSDGLFLAARKAAFEEKDYSKAKGFLYRALEKSPDYADLRVFLGRIYSWTKDYDSAGYCFNRVLTKDPSHEDAAVAYADLEYWHHHNESALRIAETGLGYHPDSKALLLRKAKILASMKKYALANIAVQQLLKSDRNNSEARALNGMVNEAS